MRWLFFATPPADGSFNMALDEALMLRAARSGDAVLRIYAWSSPTLSVGRNQRARSCYNETRARELGVSFVRRPTGGRALLHHREVTYSATLPVADATAAGAAYDFINSVLILALGNLGVSAGPASHTVAIPPGPRPCFDVPAEHEIAVDGRKLVGSAQWRRDGALLQHGSILIHDDQSLIRQLLVTPADTPAETPPAATLTGSLGFEPSAVQVAQAIRQALAVAVDQDIESFAQDPVLQSDVCRLRAHYVDPGWTWRR